MSRRPLLDLTDPYFANSYSNEVVAIQMEASLMREVVASQMASERQYRNTIAVRNASVPPEDRFGFACELYAPGTHEELRGGQPIYYPTPGSIGIGVLDVYQSLESLCGVCDVLDSVVQEMTWVHRLPAGTVMTAMKTVVLQQALIEWRLLLEEEDLTEELSKKAADEISRRPYANNFIIDDPFAMDLVIDDLRTQFDYEAETSRKTPKPGAPAAKKKSGAAASGKDAPSAEEKAPALVYEEPNHPNSMMQAHMNAIEAVLLRKKLLDSIYETDVVHLAYRAQAAAYKKDLKAETPIPIEFVHASDVESSGRAKQVTAEVSSLGACVCVLCSVTKVTCMPPSRCRRRRCLASAPTLRRGSRCSSLTCSSRASTSRRNKGSRRRYTIRSSSSARPCACRSSSAAWSPLPSSTTRARSTGAWSR